MDALPVLCLLGVFCSLALAIEKTVPPEDLDSSGDDEEEFSGSGSDGLFVDLDSKDVVVFSTSASTLVPTMEGSTAVQEPEIVDEEETKLEDATVSTETTKTHNPLIEDLFDVDTGDKEAITQEATTSPLQQTSTAEPLGEADARKLHHHHHHRHHPLNHTTTSSTSLPSESDRHNDTTDIPPDVDKPYDLPEKTTADTPDEESELHHIPQELTTPVEDLAKHGILHEDTTSGSTSTYSGTEVIADPLDADNLPALVTTTVAEDAHKDHHHHHHHHPHHLTTTSLFGGSDVQEEVTTRPSDLIELDDVQEGEPTTTVAEDDHPHHGHHHHTHHHKTTPSTTGSTEPEQVHTHEPKGRRVHVPDVRSTTAVPVINEEERFPEDAEKDDFTSTTIHYNVSGNPFDEIDDTSDSKEEGPSGVADPDIFFEVTVPVINKGRMMPPNPPATDDGTSGASHGIMERKELLAGIIAGGVAGLVFAAFLVAFVLYRMKKKDEGSYSLEERKQSNGGYQKPREQREFYA